MAWPEEQFTEIIGSAVRPEKLKAWVEDYVSAKKYCEE
jgi:hypothetical protein